MIFYDIHDQTKYAITVSRPENMEDLSDLFVTHEELQDMLGSSAYINVSTSRRMFKLNSVITAELNKWIDKLEASNKKTIKIEDEELLDILQKGYLYEFTDDNDDRYARRGDRLCYAQRYKRVKKKATQGDVNKLWTHLMYAWRAKFGCYPSHIPRCDRHITMFTAFKKIVGWRRVRARISNKADVKFYRQIWDNPEEFIT